MPYIGRTIVTNLADWHTDNYADGAGFTAGDTTTLTLTQSGVNEERSVDVYFDGVVQHHNTWSILSSVITFTSAIPLGCNNVEVRYGTVPNETGIGAGTVGTNHLIDLNVTTAKLANLNVTTGKIADLNVTTGKIADLNVTTGKIADNSVTGAKIAMGSDAAGDILYHNGTDYIRLAKGTAGQALVVNTGATAPEWSTSSGGSPANERDFKDQSGNGGSWSVAVAAGEKYYIKAIAGGGSAGSNNTGGPQVGSVGENGGIANVDVKFLVAGTLNIVEGAGGAGSAGNGSNNGNKGGDTTVTFTPTAGSAQDFIYCEGGEGERSYGNRLNAAPDDAVMRINEDTNWTIIRSLPTAVAEGVSTTTETGRNTIQRVIIFDSTVQNENGVRYAGVGGHPGIGANAGGGEGIYGWVSVYKY